MAQEEARNDVGGQPHFTAAVDVAQTVDVQQQQQQQHPQQQHGSAKLFIANDALAAAAENAQRNESSRAALGDAAAVLTVETKSSHADSPKRAPLANVAAITPRRSPRHRASAPTAKETP